MNKTQLRSYIRISYSVIALIFLAVSSVDKALAAMSIGEIVAGGIGSRVADK